MVVYRKSDRVKLKIGELKVELSPLTFAEKSYIQNMIMNDPLKGSVESLKVALKDIKGLSTPDGEEYKLAFEDGKLTDVCIDDLNNIEGINELFISCLALLNGVPDKFVDPVTGEEIKGIEIIKEARENKDEKKAQS